MGLVTVRVVGTVETFENVRRICSRNTRAVVADAEMQLFFRQLCFNLESKRYYLQLQKEQCARP